MRFGPNLKRYLPRTLFARTILIILIPLIIAQLVAGWIFYDRHYQSTTFRLAQSVAGDVALLLAEVEDAPRSDWGEIFARFRRTTDIDASYVPRTKTEGVGANDLRRQLLTDALEGRGVKDFHFGAYDDNWIVLYATTASKAPELKDSAISIRIPLRRVTMPTTLVFLGWMVGAAIVLVLVSIWFMRNQIRPIHRLAAAAEKFGRNMEAPQFKLEGAREVRQAAAAFLVMRNRLRRMIEQRTTMLAAISHDLRTPLTRLRLSLALLPPNPETEGMAEGMNADIDEMEKMIAAYLAFARGEESEPVREVDLGALVAEVASKAASFGKPVWWQAPPAPIILPARGEALRRAITNLVTNALKYGGGVWIALRQADLTAEILIEDDGPGIPADQRESAFRPFSKGGAAADTILAAGENSQSYGLGLTIARDIVRSHGGDVLLDSSAHGGLKATVQLPV